MEFNIGDFIIKIEAENLFKRYVTQPNCSDYKSEVIQELDASSNQDWSIQNENRKYYSHLKEGNKLHELRLQNCEKYKIVSWSGESLFRHNLTNLQLELKQHAFEKIPVIDTASNGGNLSYNLMLSEHSTNASRQCQICHKTISQRYWHRHMRSIHSPTKYPCLKCKKQFKCQRYLNNHVKYIHEGHRPAWYPKSRSAKEKCDMCDEIVFKSRMRLHIKTCHNVDFKEYECDICNAKLGSTRSLRRHKYAVHYDDGNKYPCKCGKEFRSPRHLKAHQKRVGHKEDIIEDNSEIEVIID